MNYKETNLSGSSYQRCNRVQIVNNYDQVPYIVFGEEKIINMGDEIVHQGVNTQNCTSQFDPVAGEISIRNPLTGELTGSSVTHTELYTILYSLYLQVAEERDIAVAAAQAAEAATLGT